MRPSRILIYFCKRTLRIFPARVSTRNSLRVYQPAGFLRTLALNIKTRSADSGSKARGSFANIFAIYVLVEDYVKKEFYKKGNYKSYGGAKFSDLFIRQRQLPFGQKLQNHALNHRLNEEFKKYFPTSKYLPIIRDASTNKYWFNENLLIISVDKERFNRSEEHTS